MRLEKLLDEFGLSGTKGTVYLAALRVGTGSVYEIAKLAALPRTTVHEILQHLTSLGLINFTSKGRTKIYNAESPEKLATILKEKERKLESVMPELLSQFNTTGTRPRVRYYEGVEGVKRVLEDTLTVSDKKLIGILSMEDLFQIPGKEFMDRYVQRRVDEEISLRVIRSEGKEVDETWRSSIKENRELHFAPQGFIFPMTMYLYDKKVSIIGTRKESFGMIFESEDFYQTQKNFFEIVWQVSKVGKRVD